MEDERFCKIENTTSIVMIGWAVLVVGSIAWWTLATIADWIISRTF